MVFNLMHCMPDQVSLPFKNLQDVAAWLSRGAHPIHVCLMLNTLPQPVAATCQNRESKWVSTGRALLNVRLTVHDVLVPAVGKAHPMPTVGAS